jgi:hypothetical protein
VKAGAFRLAGAAAVALASVTLARADAPGTQYGYFNSSAQVIQDNFTKLLWERYPPAGTVTFDDALARCATLSIGGVGGTWRLPTYKELLTIVDEAPHTEYDDGALVSKAIDPNAFPGTQVTPADWWTSSPAAGAAGASVYAINFSTGLAFEYDVTTLGYARCVQYVGP